MRSNKFSMQVRDLGVPQMGLVEVQHFRYLSYNASKKTTDTDLVLNSM